MTTIVTRAGKGSALTHNEVDSNFTNLNDAKYESGNNATFGTVGATAGTFTSLTDSGNLTFTGTGNRILGDFSNATIASRVAFQTSTTNGNTAIPFIPNGTATTSALFLFNNSDTANSAFLNINNSASSTAFNSTISGTGSYVPMTFSTGGSERMRIDTSGNVGIGTSSPSAQLVVVTPAAVATQATNKGNIQIVSNPSATTAAGGLEFAASSFGAGYGWKISTADAGSGIPLGFCTRQNSATWSEIMRIDSSGNVGIGTSSPSRALTVFTTAATDNNLLLRSGAANAYLTFADSGTTDQTGLSVRIGSSGNNLVFNTGGTTERMRIDSSGNLLVGTTTLGGEGGISILPNFDDGAGRIIFDRASTAANSVVIEFENGGSTVGQITISNIGTTYATSSDYRLKENIAPMTGALDKVAQLKPVTYTWKADGSDGQGFIAHELQAVCPDAVTGEKDAVDKDGKPVYQGIDTSFLVATLTKAIQELSAKVDTLQAELNTLKGN
jgi:hypothetical protein